MKRDEVIGKTDYDFFIPELADCYKMHDSKILETGVPEQLEEVSYLVDGWHTFIANKFPLYDSQGKPYAICGISTDITELKKIESTLRESEHIYRAIGESIDYGIWVCDPDGRNTYASPSFLKMVGITQQQCSEFGWVIHSTPMMPRGPSQRGRSASGP